MNDAPPELLADVRAARGCPEYTREPHPFGPVPCNYRRRPDRADWAAIIACLFIVAVMA